MNESTVKGKWTELKGEIQQMWGKLSHDDLDRTKGNITAIAGLIEQNYGEAKDAVTEKLNTLFNRGAEKAADKSEDAKNTVKNLDADKDKFNGANKH